MPSKRLLTLLELGKKLPTLEPFKIPGDAVSHLHLPSGDHDQKLEYV